MRRLWLHKSFKGSGFFLLLFFGKKTLFSQSWSHRWPYKLYLLASNIFIHWLSPKLFHFINLQQRLQAWTICQLSLSLITGWRWAGDGGFKKLNRHTESKRRRSVNPLDSRATSLGSIDGHISEPYIHLPTPHELIIGI